MIFLCDYCTGMWGSTCCRTFKFFSGFPLQIHNQCTQWSWKEKVHILKSSVNNVILALFYFIGSLYYKDYNLEQSLEWTKPDHTLSNSISTDAITSVCFVQVWQAVSLCCLLSLPWMTVLAFLFNYYYFSPPLYIWRTYSKWYNWGKIYSIQN